MRGDRRHASGCHGPGKLVQRLNVRNGPDHRRQTRLLDARLTAVLERLPIQAFYAGHRVSEERTTLDVDQLRPDLFGWCVDRDRNLQAHGSPLQYVPYGTSRHMDFMIEAYGSLRPPLGPVTACSSTTSIPKKA